MGPPGSPETRRAQTRTGSNHDLPEDQRRDALVGILGTRAAWSQATREVFPRYVIGAPATVRLSGVGWRSNLFRNAVEDILRPGSGSATVSRHGAGMVSIVRSSDASPPLTLRQLLTEQGVSILGLILQPKLIYPDALPFSKLQAEPDAPAGDGAASADRAERSAIHLEFRARMAAARICLPKDILAAALGALHRERRAALQALRDKIAARRAMQARERLARSFRRAAALTARGMPRRPVLETAEETRSRVRLAILSTFHG